LTAGWYLPIVAFVALAAMERASALGGDARRHGSRADHLLNLAGLAIQGAAIPVAGYLIATRVLAVHFPDLSGSLAIGWWGAFLLNFVVVDLLYYLQHRAFHRVGVLWALHRCHHAAPDVNVWATSRNSLAINFLFVYLLVNPALGFLCDRPDAFFLGAALTAALDLWRHSRVPERYAPAWLGRVLVTPAHHHLHHGRDGHDANFGANLMVWDRLFGTAREPRGYPARYGIPDAPGPWRQFFLPW
jgi:sterol desaturase/sphingolipid hydroxylase (fatty acid hydroxylase superfamily)